ncbi:hypothetical protein PoB_001341400 [Plakobranchus ocellatus]|uniref:Uncharacterized protein n=1 Tax=Plakobranchus ocellatus TaxID=259542 RepID=A0AAV3YV09_9GAST|nr:hypothetical protein PoB_001341400 [Plakobranchus ocellatus]
MSLPWPKRWQLAAHRKLDAQSNIKSQEGFHLPLAGKRQHELHLCKAFSPRRNIGMGLFPSSPQSPPEPKQGDPSVLCQGYPGALLPTGGIGPLLGLTQTLFEEN